MRLEFLSSTPPSPTEGSGTCGMPFSCEVDADTCQASCSDDSEVKVTPNEDGFTFTPDGGGNCTVKVNGSTFSGLCTQGATVCKLSGSYSDDGFAGTKSDLMVPLNLTEQEIDDIVAFLDTLTGEPVPVALRTDTSKP